MEANSQVRSTNIWDHPGSVGGALRMRCHVEETGLSASRCPWVYLHVSKEMSWRRVPQPQLPLLIMPSGSEQISQLNFSQTPNTHTAISKLHRSWKQLGVGRVGFAVIDHWDRIHLPKMLIWVSLHPITQLKFVPWLILMFDCENFKAQPLPICLSPNLGMWIKKSCTFSPLVLERSANFSHSSPIPKSQ